MKLKVTRAFVCRLTGRPYNPGSYYETDDVDRITELQEAGFVEQVPLPALTKTVETAVKEAPEKAVKPKARRKKVT